MADIREKLEGEVERQIDELPMMDTGSESMSRAVGDIATLCNLIIENDKNEIERDEKRVERSDQKKDRIIRYAIEVGGILAMTGFNVYVFVKGVKFEETGTFTSQTFKRYMNNFPKPFKR